MNSLRSAYRSAFTLVELLVVIVIIGILMALLIPVLGGVFSTSIDARMALEVNNLTQAVEAYRMEMNEYPPDFAGVDIAQDMQQMQLHLARKVRSRKPQDQNAFGNAEQVWAGLDPAEALVFWLSGISSDPSFPLLRRGKWPTDVQVDTSNPLNLIGRIKGDKPFFEFDQARLLDKDGDGWPEYYPTNSEAPYVYIRSTSYGQQQASGQYSSNQIPMMNGAFSMRAYAAELDLTSGLVARFAEQDKYQIICAGQDGMFDTDATLGVYPEGIGYSEAESDNIANFSGGKTLQDAIP